MNKTIPDKYEIIIKETELLNVIFKKINICKNHCNYFMENENCYYNCLNKLNFTSKLSIDYINNIIN